MFYNNFLKVASVTPKCTVGNPRKNVEEILHLLKNIKSSITVFPELSVTAYTCNDLFFQDGLLTQTEAAIAYFLKHNPSDGIVVIGAPLKIEDVLYNTAFVIQKDTILGIVPKFYLPNTKEFYEKRWFQSGFEISEERSEVRYLDQVVPFGHLVFNDTEHDVTFGVEICEDMWAPISPGNILALNGAKIILNLSASNEVLGKRQIRKQTILEHTRRNAGAYIYSSAGVHESTSETVFSGHNMIAQNGDLIIETENFNQESEIIYGDIDLDKIAYDRRTNSSFRDTVHRYRFAFKEVSFSCAKSDKFDFEKPFDKTPFVPKKAVLKQFEKIAALQENALMKRIKHVNSKTLIVGVSGGLDSTLALLIAVRAFDAIRKPRKDIIAVTMPGLHTSDRTKQQADALMAALGVTQKEIAINDHVKHHFELIGHDGKTEDITYENTQARVRTMVLMNLANMYHGLVLGTGDLSELALGWCTYNGDQMSMYGINAGIPKTLVRFMIEHYAKEMFDNEAKQTLLDIVDTPITPELASNQMTEEAIGKYEINDFIIHRLLRYGDNACRIRFLLETVFELEQESADRYVHNFFKRFYSQQFKRQALPDGPKILDISLSPRGDLRLPSDIAFEVKSCPKKPLS
ncbi:MAG: NAD(+) synthase [Candidatus Izemoplasma sp.]|nr:NAD(+) synthase [Candidatus Izemoplasma sp.]